jgi:hypothetical protein
MEEKMKNWSPFVFVGVLLVLIGPGTVATIIAENWRIPRSARDRGGWVKFALGIIGFLVGICLITFGCGASVPQPTDPVTVEVSVCEPTLGGTLGQYYRLKIWRRGEGVCEAMLESSEERRRAICAVAEDDIDRLDRELDAYLASGRDDCYSGPVFNEMQDLVEEKRQTGTLCREP